MSKYKIKPTPKKEILSSQDAKDEKQFFKVAIVVTLVVIIVIYFIFNYL